jgi:hypothetical protein
MIRKLKTGEYRLYSRKKNAKTGKRRNLGTFTNRRAAQAHEKAVQYFSTTSARTLLAQRKFWRGSPRREWWPDALLCYNRTRFDALFLMHTFFA